LQELRGPKPPADDSAHEFYSITFSPDSRSVVAGSTEDCATLFDAASGKILRKFPSDSGSVESVAVSPDGSKMLMGTDQTKAVLWDLKSGKQLRTFHCSMEKWQESVNSVAFSPDGRKMLASIGGPTFLFDIDSGKLLHTFDSGDHTETYAIFSPDGRQVLTSGRRLRLSCPEIILWDVATGNRTKTYQGPKDAIRSLEFDKDGNRLIVGYMQGCGTIWDMNTGKPLGKLEQAKAEEAEEYEDTPDQYTSPDGRWIVSQDKYSMVVLTDTHTSKKTKMLEQPVYGTLRVAFSLKTSRMAVADEDSVHIFNPETGKELATLISAYGGRDWLTTTPGNFFDGSPGGLSLISWHVGEADYPCRHFEKQFHQPDVIAKALQTKP
jgi:WD40 repeat protein